MAHPTTDDELLRRYLAHPPRRRASVWERLFVLGIWGALLYAIAASGPELLVRYGVVSVETMERVLQVEGATAAPAFQPMSVRPQAPPIVRPSLPPCSQVYDTTTACVQDSAEQGASIAEQSDALRSPLSAPTLATPTPPYLAACWTVPGERPCWLPEGQAWEPLASVPETPIVLVQPPLVDVCAAWRPPLQWPEGCEE
jgi:hypothetical protein